MPPSATKPGEAAHARLHQVEQREWWLWSLAVLVTLLLTAGIASFLMPFLHAQADSFYFLNLRLAARGLVGVVLLFDIYTLYQQLQISRMRRRLSERDELFRLVSENAGDMIALVDMEGNRLYNSPAYQKVLGYSAEELSSTSSFEQIHPDDRHRVLEAAEHAKRTGTGRTLEYRIRHKDGSWRILESSASPILDKAGRAEKMVIVEPQRHRPQTRRGQAGPPEFSRCAHRPAQPQPVPGSPAARFHPLHAASRIQVCRAVHRRG